MTNTNNKEYNYKLKNIENKSLDNESNYLLKINIINAFYSKSKEKLQENCMYIVLTNIIL